MKETREKIVIKALQYFVENDYQAVSLTSIAEGIGITKGGIYHYFDSKDELLMECILTVFKTIGEFSATSFNENTSPEDVLKGFFSFKEIIKMMADSLNLELNNYFNFYYLIFLGVKKFPEIGEAMVAIYRRMQQELEHLFERFKERGVIRKDLNTRAFSLELITMVEGVMLVYSFSTEMDLDELGKDMVSSVLERIMA